MDYKDYPLLLLPCCVARLFVYTHGYNDIAPRVLNLLFSFCIFLLLYYYLIKLRNWYLGIIAIAFLSFSEKFMMFNVWQYADTPLTVYILISMYELIMWITENKYKEMPNAAIFSASLALWTKNEGIVFALLLVFTVICYCRKNKIELLKNMKSFAYLLPSIIALFMVKCFCNENNDILGDAWLRLSGFKNLDYYVYVFCFRFILFAEICG